MTISLKHTFECLVADGSDDTIVQPSDWNDEHVITMASGYMLGRTSASEGVVEELSASVIRTFLSLVIGTDVQAYSGNLDLWSAVAPSSYYTAAQVDAAFQPLDANLTAIAALTTTSYGRALLELADSAALTALISGLNLASQVTGTLPIANGGTGQTTAAAAYNAIKQAATTSATGAVELATDAEVRSAASGASGKAVGANQIESASAVVTISDAATIAVDWDTFINGEVTLGGNRTLGAPTNGQPGTWRKITVIQDGTGSRTLSFNAVYKFAGGTAPTLSTAASSVDVLYIYCRTTSFFEVSSALDWS